MKSTEDAMESLGIINAGWDGDWRKEYAALPKSRYPLLRFRRQSTVLESAEFARRLGGVYEVDASGLELSKEVLEVFAGQEHLTGLILATSKFAPDAIHSLANNKSLRFLNVQHTSFGDEEFEAFLTKGAIVELDARHTSVTADGDAPLHGSAIVKLAIGPTNITGGAMVRVSSCSMLTQLSLAGCTGLDEAVASLTSPTLREIDLEGSDIGDRGLSEIVRLPALRKLGLRGTKVTSIGIMSLGGSNVEDLDLSGIALTDEAVTVIDEMPSIKRVLVWKELLSPKSQEIASRWNRSSYYDH